jgi:hypothetical protein
MTITPRIRLASVVLVAALLSTMLPSLPARAGTTGSVSGVVTDTETNAPVADAKVTVVSPSETASATTNASGHYAFASLIPDEYTVSVARTGYDSSTVSGVTVLADATQVVSVRIHKSLTTIASVTSRSAASLVRPGTTADVYSVNAAQQERTSVLGGGGNLNSAYSAIASVPGAYVPSNQNGYNQAVHVRGGDSSEVGYEFDGIPVNRGFDNYPGGGASSLGQLELQVYTGATPANGEAQGLAGFINQVIKTGTYPGYASASLSVGTPTFYHDARVEAGGSSPNRLFSYYVGIGGFYQDHRYLDQFNGASVSNEFGPVLDQCQPVGSLFPNPPASCLTNGAPNVGQAGAPGYILGPLPFGNDAAGVNERTSVINLHFGIPHKNGAGRDDVQLLYDNDFITTPLYVSALDEGLNNFQGQLFYPKGTLPYYQDSWQYLGPTGTLLPANAASLIVPYYFPSSPQNRPMFANIPLSERDVQYNNQNIFKVQYQKNFSSDSFLRLYGYTYYSDYIGTGDVSSFQAVTGFDSGDYEVSSHTRGISATFAKQLSAQHLLQAEASYTTSRSLRDNNSQMFFTADAFAALVNPHNLASGTCYTLPSTGTAAAATTCNGGSATFASLSGGIPAIGNATCGGVPCAYYVVENGEAGKYNSVTPNFTGYSITDEYRPNDKLLINLGLRLDTYQFQGANTTGTAARTFWFNAFNNDTCFDTQNLTLYDKTFLADGSSIPVNANCSIAGSSYRNLKGNINNYAPLAPGLVNVPSQVFTYNILQPRIGATYTLNPLTVLRASYGKYIEQPSAAYVQYNSLQQNLPSQLAVFYPYGFYTPGHEVRPSISYNTDFSLEHQFKGTDLSVKVTPFYRQTKNQIENFYLNIQQGFVSGLNAGNQTSEGFEFALNKGDFSRNGFAGQLAFTYTNVYVTYNRLSNGTTILDPINAAIKTYNGYTSFCASHPTDRRCGSTTSGVADAPCYTTGGLPDPACATSSVANPYWDAPVQPLLDINGKYLPFSTIPGGVGSGVESFNYPYNATLILSYKHNKLAITPSFQFVAGNRYGAPETTPGIDPISCGTPLSGAIDRGRYPYGAVGGSPYDATTCASQLAAIPDQYTGQFDPLGAFRQPAQLLGHLRITYDLSPKVSLNLTAANLLSTCFGGENTRFTYYWSRGVCSYGAPQGSGIVPVVVGNVYNPGDNIQTFQKYPYEPSFGTYNDLTSSLVNPFSLYFTVNLKL